MIAKQLFFWNLLLLCIHGIWAQTTLPPPEVPSPLVAANQYQEIWTCTCGAEPASFQGGPTAMQRYIINNLNYTCLTGYEDLLKNRTIYFRFDVDIDGSISNIVLMRGISTRADACLKQLIAEMPHWVPTRDPCGGALKSTILVPVRISML